MNTDLRDAGIFLFAAAFFVYDMVNGLRVGNIRLLYIQVKRNEHPILFWYGVVLSVVLIGSSLALFIYYLHRGS